MIVAVFVVAVLLLLGVWLRQTFPIIARLSIPGSVVAGVVGLVAVSVVGDRAAALTQELSNWPGTLIAVVFAAMMLMQPSQRHGQRDRATTRRVGRQVLMVWIVVVGETFVGLLATWLLIKPFFDVPNSFGMLIETGFAGGHGTAAAMGEVFASDQVGFDAGLDLGLLMATCGLVYGVVSGIVWINIASRRGWFDENSLRTADQDENEKVVQTETHSGTQVDRESIDPLLLQMTWIAIAIGLGWLVQYGVLTAAGQLDVALGLVDTGTVSGAEAELSKRLTASKALDFPLFIYAMFGGWLVRQVLIRVGQARLLAPATLDSLGAAAMEILVVAAITSLQFSTVVSLLVPFCILFAAGAVWTATCLIIISRGVLPRGHWFPLGLINYGMSTGTTATGFILLRVVDPHLKTPAASDYALAAPFSAPFIGGGILTIALPLLVLENVSLIWPVIVLGIVVTAMIAVGVWLNRQESTES